MKQPKCITNPATGEPFSRHLWGPVSSYVVSYSLRSGTMAPHSYAYERTCKRCGLKDSWT